MVLHALWPVGAIALTVSIAGPGQLPRNVHASATPQERPVAESRPGVPHLGNSYTLPLGDVPGPRVSFEQTGDVVLAVWMTDLGEVYGRGTYRWDDARGVFVGTSSTRVTCATEEDGPLLTYEVHVHEELSVSKDGGIRDRRTKPLDIDCSVGVVQRFKWVERLWLPADQEWKPLPVREVAPGRSGSQPHPGK